MHDLLSAKNDLEGRGTHDRPPVKNDRGVGVRMTDC